MERSTVKSSNIKSVGYDLDAKLFEVEFHSGRIYQYSGVPLMAVQQFWRAKSAGRYFNEVIRKGYDYKEVTETDDGQTVESIVEEALDNPRVVKKTKVKRLKK